MPLGFLARYVDDIAKTISSTMKGAGPEVLGGLKNWWKSGGAKAGAEVAQEMGEDLTKSKYIRTNFFRALEDKVDQANKYLIDIAQKKATEIRTFKTQLERMDRTIAQYDKAGEEVPNMLRKRKAFIERTLEQAEKTHNEIVDLYKLANVSEDPRAALAFLNSHPELLKEGLGIGEWSRVLNQVMRGKAGIDVAQSKNINNSAKFIEEYLAKKRMPGGGEELDKWLSNTENYKKLESLMTRENVVKLLESGAVKVPFRMKLLGLTPIDMAKRLGIGLTAMSGGIGALKLFSWFDRSAKEGSAKSSGLLGVLSSVETSGPGLTVLNNAKKSANRIKQLSEQLDKGLDQDPEKVAKMYLTGVAQEITNLSLALKEWNKVVQYSPKKDIAEKAGVQLSEYIRSAQDNLVKLGASVGQPIKPQQVGRYTPPANTEIRKIQELLNQKGYKIAATGEIDASTVAALESLESEYKAASPNYDIAGSFVNRQNGSIISYNDLINALNILEK